MAEPIPAKPSIAVVIPCYQEALTIGKVIADFRRELPTAKIYVYDNNCTDGTAALAAFALTFFAPDDCASLRGQRRHVRAD
jgi:glycosyltransferase involved in cell wall biosynthesis